MGKLEIFGWGFGFIAIVFVILTAWSFVFNDLRFSLIMAGAMFFFEISSIVMFIKSDKEKINKRRMKRFKGIKK